jgi:DNA-binding NarL/FixJ family response regulator
VRLAKLLGTMRGLPIHDRPIRVALVDAHRMFTQALQGLLAREPGIDPVGAAASVEEALDLTERTQPDVVLMDVELPGADGVDATLELARRRPETAVVIVTSQDDPEVLAEAMRAGARGFVLKTRAVEDLVGIIRQASVIGGVRRGIALTHVGGPTSARARPPGAPPGGLTEREMDVLRELAAGRSTEQVATALFISVLTVRSHVKSILAKLGAHSKLEAVTYAIHHGLVDTSRPA